MGTSIKSDDHLDYIMDKYEKPILIDFFMEKCNPCKKFMPEWNKLYEKMHSKVKMVKANRENVPYYRQEFGVRSYPTVLLLLPNGEQHVYKGKREARKVYKWTKEIVMAYYRGCE